MAITKIKKYLKKFYIGYFCAIYRKQYAYKLKVNGIPNVACEGEQMWGGYWKALGINPLSESYRLFSRYMKADTNILPETTSHYVIEPILNPIKMRGYYADKNFFEKICPEGFCPKALLRRIRNHYYNADYRLLNLDEAVFGKILKSCDSRKIIVKPSVDSCSGLGVVLFAKGDDGIYRHSKTHEALTCAWVEKNLRGEFIMQEAVEQSDFMSQFCDTSVNTLRMAVYRSVKDDECHVTACIMRIGSKGSFVDNSHAGGMFVGISPDGELGHEVYDQHGVRKTNFNGVDFAGQTFRVPAWDNIVKFAVEVGRSVPHHRLLALDVAVRKDGTPVLIEYNVDSFSMWLFQFTGRPALGDYTQEIKEYCEKHLSDNTLALYV